MREDMTEKNRSGEKAVCLQAKKCGGCQYIGVPYEEQLRKKQKRIEELMKGICPIRPIRGMEDPLHYRNKVHAVFGIDRRGNVISGTYEAKSHRIVPIKSCLIEDEKADEIIGTIRGMLRSFKIKTYDENTGYGLLRHVLVRRGFSTGEVMVVLVTGSPVFPSKNNFVRALREKHPEITMVVQNINGQKTSMVLGERENVLYGKGYIEDVISGIRFRISSRSFYQVNPVQTEHLYKKAIELAKLTGKETVLDAYCGIGTIGLSAAHAAKKVIGVELNRDAVKDAVLNKKINGIKNAEFYCNDATKFMVQMAEQDARPDVVFLDPPRSGSTEEFIGALSKMGPSRVVYVSCGPDTLARDLKVFAKKGYRAAECWPFDMFPFTEHVETVCLLSKLSGAKNHISVKVEMDEMDLTAAESKATYQEIQDWVQEKYGFHVTHLNIAKTKRKCGIIERQNFNLPKSDDSRSPETQKDKEEAIIEAFRHFQMI